jgi:hypothetical protein
MPMMVKTFILLYSQPMMMACGVLARYVSAAIKSIASLRHRWRGSTEAKQVQVVVIATAYIPNSRLLRRAERAREQ